MNESLKQLVYEWCNLTDKDDIQKAVKEWCEK